MKDWLARLEKRENIQIAFKNIDLRIVCPVKRTQEVSTIILHARRPKPIVTCIAPTESTNTAKLMTMRDNADTIAKHIASPRERYIGFTLADVERIARCFKYWPMEQPLREGAVVGEDEISSEEVYSSDEY